MSTSNQTYKELAIPYFKEVFDIIDQIMKEMELPYYLVGATATALELLSEGIKPNRGTKDIDFAVMISSLSEYEILSKKFEDRGFAKVKAPWTFYSEKFNVAIDILPFGEIEENDTIKFNKRYSDLHVLGFKEVLQEGEQISIEEKIAGVPPLPGMVILKLVAWSDRPEERENDLEDILTIISHYYEYNEDEILEVHWDTFTEADVFDRLKIASEVLGRKANIFFAKSNLLYSRIHGLLENQLGKEAESEIARRWAQLRDWDIAYSLDLLAAFKRGLNYIEEKSDETTI